MYAYTSRPEPLATQALRMTAEDIADVPPTCANTLYRDETGRLQRGPPKFDARPTKTYLVPQSDGHHGKCAMTYRGNTQKFQSSLKRRTTSSFSATSTRNSKMMSQTIPAPNGQVSNASAFAATAALKNADASATANFTVDPTVASAVQTQKRTLNPQRGLNNSTFNTTGRIALAENAPRKFIPAGYQGHVQGSQHIFGKSFSSISEAILTYRDDTRTPTKPSYQEII